MTTTGLSPEQRLRDALFGPGISAKCPFCGHAAGQHTVYYVKPARISVDVTSPLTIGSVTCDQCADDLGTIQVFCWRNPERQ